jgi:hypothetical protein
VTVYEQALLERRARVPLNWATTQNNVGNALATLGSRESGTERLEQAVAAHRNAILAWEQSAVPEGWALWAMNRVATLEALIAFRRLQGVNQGTQRIS